jgi:predicted GNAT superfamily acetyltransferase
MCPHDLGEVLALNREWEHVTSPLTLEALERLHALAALRLVADDGSSVLAFALAFGPETDYDSPNYRWFDSRSGDFLYIDRVVVTSAAQRSGLGHMLYAKVFDSARERGASRVVCEVDLEPLNVASDAFHRRWGFVEVGTQLVHGGAKRVSLRERTLD